MSHENSFLNVIGSTTTNPYEDLKRVLNFAKNERHYVASELYENVKERINDWEAHGKGNVKNGFMNEISGGVVYNRGGATTANDTNDISFTAENTSPSKTKFTKSVANIRRKFKKKGRMNDDEIDQFRKASAFLEEKKEDFDAILVSRTFII